MVDYIDNFAKALIPELTIYFNKHIRNLIRSSYLRDQTMNLRIIEKHTSLNKRKLIISERFYELIQTELFFRNGGHVVSEEMKKLIKPHLIPIKQIIEDYII